MRIITVGTGSKGNCYVVEAKNGEQLLIECGVPFKEVIKVLDYDISHIVGCIASHEHSDHYGQHKQFEKYAIGVWKAWEEENTIKLFGGFNVVSFDLPHDGTENRGFMIRADGECLIYLTDMEMCRYVFKTYKPTVLMIECNNDGIDLDTEEVKYAHVVRGHCSVPTAKGIVEANKTDALKAVVLIHASKDNLNKEYALKEIGGVLDEKVTLCFADKGKAIEI